MKRVLVTLVAAVLAMTLTASTFTLSTSDMHKKKDTQTIESLECHHKHNVVKEKKKCSCGGDLEWKATAYKVYKTCSLCKGKGVYDKETCTLCKGSGKDYEWKSGYVCKKCGKVYKD